MKRVTALILAIFLAISGGAMAQSPTDSGKHNKAKPSDQLEGMIYLNHGSAGAPTLGISGYEITLSQDTVVPSTWNLKTGEVVIGAKLRFRVRGTIVKETIVATEIVQLEPAAEGPTPASTSQ